MPVGCSGEMLDARSWACHSLPFSSSVWAVISWHFRNVLTEHSACTVAFSLTGLVISFALILPRRLEIFHRSVLLASSELTPNHIPLFPQPPPPPGTKPLAIANIVFAYAGHVAFFTFFSELKDIRDYPKSLALLQFSEILLYSQRYSNICLLIRNSLPQHSILLVHSLGRSSNCHPSFFFFFFSPGEA